MDGAGNKKRRKEGASIATLSIDCRALYIRRESYKKLSKLLGDVIGIRPVGPFLSGPQGRLSGAVFHPRPNGGVPLFGCSIFARGTSAYQRRCPFQSSIFSAQFVWYSRVTSCLNLSSFVRADVSRLFNRRSSRQHQGKTFDLMKATAKL